MPKSPTRVPRPRPWPVPVLLKRVRDHGVRRHVTHWFQFEGGGPKSSRSRSSLVRPADMPPFEGEEGWFLVEKMPKDAEHRWSYWRAVRQVDPPVR